MKVKDLVLVRIDGRQLVGYVDELVLETTKELPKSVHVIGVYLDYQSPWGPPKFPPLSWRVEVALDDCQLLFET